MYMSLLHLSNLQLIICNKKFFPVVIKRQTNLVILGFAKNELMARYIFYLSKMFPQRVALFKGEKDEAYWTSEKT